MKTVIIDDDLDAIKSLELIIDELLPQLEVTNTFTDPLRALKKIPLIFNGFSNGVWPLTDFNYDDIEVSSFDKLWDSLKVGIPSESLNFNPTSGWKGNIEF